MLYLEHLSFGKNGLVFKDKHGRTLSISQGVKKAKNRIFNYLLDCDLFILRVVGFFPIYSIRFLFYKLAGIKLNSSAHVHMGAQFFNPRNISIGKGTIVGQGAFLDGRDKLIIGDFVDIASDVMIYNSEHNIHSENFEAIESAVRIGDYAFIGPRVIILPGVIIGKGAIVAAGAVVTKNVEDFKIVGGVPAVEIGERKIKELNYKLGRARLFS